MTFYPAHIFCDESGGTDKASGAFVAAAVSIVPGEANRLVRRFRKAARITSEVKGHRLTARQRWIFFDMLSAQTDLGGVAVTCGHFEPLGAWAIHHLREIDLYGYMMTEACRALPAHTTVTLDGGRYKKAPADVVRQAIARATGAEQVAFGDSATLAGLQVADVIANTVFQSLGSGEAAEAAKAILAMLTGTGRLSIQSVRLDGVRPAWLTEG
jgi:hypothetical protein